jgi:hypothetical protein
MEQEKIKLKQRAEQLAEKYEDTKDKQEELTKRQDIDCGSNFLAVIEASQGRHHMTVSVMYLNLEYLKNIFADFFISLFCSMFPKCHVSLACRWSNGSTLCL